MSNGNTYHSLQLSLSIPHKIGDIISEQSECQVKQNNFTIIDNKNETKGKSKRIYSEDEKEDLVTDNNKSKKIKLNSNKGN
ncbi:18618_t:CDS:2 [Rhizophagus irregularis]|nr:18618_t:CDS:2 [Rhizophagus irregularis]